MKEFLITCKEDPCPACEGARVMHPYEHIWKELNEISYEFRLANDSTSLTFHERLIEAEDEWMMENHGMNVEQAIRAFPDEIACEECCGDGVKLTQVSLVEAMEELGFVTAMTVSGTEQELDLGALIDGDGDE